MKPSRGDWFRYPAAIAVTLGVVVGAGAARSQDRPGSRYVGPSACRDCHPEEYRSFSELSKKARSYASVEKMRPKLTEQEFRGCLECHTTGFGQPGGFRSEAETPELKNAGCEVCHGPGSRHVSTGAADDIRGKLDREDCEGCHNQERVEAFRYTPLIFGGGH